MKNIKKFDSNLCRGREEREFYFRECGNKHNWEIKEKNENGITFYCKRCFVLAQTKIPKILKEKEAAKSASTV